MCMLWNGVYGLIKSHSHWKNEISFCNLSFSLYPTELYHQKKNEFDSHLV